ncbi:hypothetical protein LK09_17505 [Microbacterium mangrovi]|uniref:Antitoxin FitA-like ribbon-helix-helix domain-containing protein n=1 Tax=Microbacterium mangrovi TaxID=1348253 RepID=A0A0B2A2K7_9MICO|nr:hypothetical protein [Microbacterium mangrovi]KHK95827.1 hypothetical protein LK09_17505 [Microbacterium mangrovi]
MASMTIRNLDDETKARLRVRAARHGRSTEAEVRAILTAAVSGAEVSLGTRFAELYANLGPLDVEPRTEAARAVDFPR